MTCERLARTTFALSLLCSLCAHATNTGLTNPVDYQADLVVEQLDKDESVIKTYNFRGCFPVNVSAIELNYETVDTVEEFTVEFAIQYWESNTTS